MARILVVEDDAGQLEVRRLILEQSGHDVITAQTAAEAIDRLPGCQVVLMDLQLPTPEDGMKLIRAASGAARIVVLSGGEHQNMPPVDAFLTKPCSSRKLLETIARFCLLLICFSVLTAAGHGRPSRRASSFREPALRSKAIPPVGRRRRSREQAVLAHPPILRSKPAPLTV